MTEPAPLSPSTQHVRERLLARLLDVAAVVGGVAYLPSAYLSWVSSLWVVFAADTVAFLVVIGLSRVPRLPYGLKLGSILVITYGLGLALVILTGPFGAGHLFLFAFVMFVALFGGFRAMIVGNGLALLTNVGFAVASAVHWLPWVQSFPEVVVVSANFVLISAILSFAAWYLVRGYSRAADEEKHLRITLEMLLHEMEHRVKNNLQVISSLVNLRTKSKADPSQVLSSLRETLVAINVVHRLLYRRESFYLLELRSLLESLVESFRRLYGSIDYQLDWKGPDLEVNGERAVSFGIMVNEVVMNAAKHAFGPERGRVVIAAEFHSEDRSFRLTIADNGRGMPPGARPQGNGIAIIYGVAKHMGARVETDVSHGVSYTFAMTIPELIRPTL